MVSAIALAPLDDEFAVLADPGRLAGTDLRRGQLLANDRGPVDLVTRVQRGTVVLARGDLLAVDPAQRDLAPGRRSTAVGAAVDLPIGDLVDRNARLHPV